MNICNILNRIEPVEMYHHCIDPEKDEDEPERSPILLIHGLMGSRLLYLDLDEIIAKRTKRKVCAVDLRNHGDSPWNNRTDIAAAAVDIGHFLDTHNIKKINLVGESIGGKIAIHYTLNNPDRIDSLITEDIRPNGIGAKAVATVKMMILVFQELVNSQPDGMEEIEAKKWFRNKINKKLEQMGFVERLSEDSWRYFDLRLVNRKWQSKNNIDLILKKVSTPKEVLTESSGLYTGPVLFIYGTESIFHVDEDKDNILKLFPNAKLVPVEGAGHTIHEYPLYRPQYEDTVIKFLNELN